MGYEARNSLRIFVPSKNIVITVSDVDFEERIFPPSDEIRGMWVYMHFEISGEELQPEHYLE